MEKHTSKKTTETSQKTSHKNDASSSSLAEVIKRLPRSSLALSKSDLSEMAKNIAEKSPTSHADKKAR